MSASHFKLLRYACIQFVSLTLIGMLLYPGGRLGNESTPRYDFFRNFFSDLGMTYAHNGDRNFAAAALFVIALGGAGISLAIFCFYVTRLFKHNRLLYVIAWIGSIFGIISGLSYVGVALTPANLLIQPHVIFVQLAFVSYLVTASAYTIVIFASADFHNSYAVVYLIFAGLLSFYVNLLFNGPGLSDDNGLIIQATGQKMIAYASIISMYIQAIGAERVAQRQAA